MTSWARDIVTPSFASASACLRLAGVIRLAAPSSSFSPQRPQLESSFMALRKSASVAIFGRALFRVRRFIGSSCHGFQEITTFALVPEFPSSASRGMVLLDLTILGRLYGRLG